MTSSNIDGLHIQALNEGSPKANTLKMAIAPTFQLCGLCDQDSSNTKVVGTHDDWAVKLQCQTGSCKGRAWFVCCVCKKTTIKIVSKKQFTDHKNSSSHKRAMAEVQENKRQKIDGGPKAVTTVTGVALAAGMANNSAVGNDLADSAAAFEQLPDNSNNANSQVMDEVLQDTRQARTDTSEAVFPWSEVKNAMELGFENEKSKMYFYHYHITKGKMGGMDLLVKQSLKEKTMQPEQLDQMKILHKHILLQMKIAKVASVSTPKELASIADILDGVYEYGLENGYAGARDATNDNFNKKLSQMTLSSPESFEKDYIVKEVTPAYDAAVVSRGQYEYQIPIPRNIQDCRRFLTQNKLSIVSNLPYPKIKKDVKGHSYVSIIDCLRHALAHCNGARLAVVSYGAASLSVNHCSQSLRALSIFDTVERSYPGDGPKPVVSYFTFWSDDFEPNSLSKSGRGSVWIKTMTMATQLNDGHRFQNTYPIAVGKKGDSHDDVEKMIDQEVKKLAKGVDPFYVGAHKKMLPIHFGLLATLQDQPERRTSNGLAAGNGLYTARWGVSANHNKLYAQQHLKSCQACLDTMVTRFSNGNCDLPLPECQVCLNWDALKDSHLTATELPVDYPTESGYPNCRIEITQGSLEPSIKPFRITYDGLKKAIDNAHANFCGGFGWSAKNCIAYLKVEGLSTMAIDEFIDHSTLAYSLHLAEASTDPIIRTTLLPLLKSQKKKEGDKFEKVHNPLWDREGIELWTHIDVVMHLLFLGIVQTLLTKIKDWLSAEGKYTDFIRESSIFLDEVRGLSIDWLLIMPYTRGKLGSWVSENYLGFSRIMLWFFQDIDKAKEGVNTNIPPPDLHHSKWLKPHLQYWLQRRGLMPKDKATIHKHDLVNLVDSYMSQAEVPPELPEPVRTKQDVEDTIVALTNLLQLVMGSSVDSQILQKTEYATRIFLSHFDRLDRSLIIGQKSGKASVISSYNFPSLMNLAMIMTMFGPLRHLWEGGWKGEGFLRFVKPLFNTGFRTNWHFNLLRKLHSIMAFDSILPEPAGAPKTSKNKPKNVLLDNQTKFQKYASQEIVLEILNTMEQSKRKKPLSVVLVVDNSSCERIFAVVEDYEHVIEVQALLEDVDMISKFGLDYFAFNYMNEGGVLQWQSLCQDFQNPSFGFGILLPLLGDAITDGDYCFFALVSSNWKSLTLRNSIRELIDTEDNSDQDNNNET